MTPSEPVTSTRTDRLAEALERARAGDTGGLDEIVRELTPLLWHVARSQGVDRADVADVVQHSWLELVSRLDAIRSPSALTAWLVTTTKREAWRVNRRRQTPVDPDDPRRRRRRGARPGIRAHRGRTRPGAVAGVPPAVRPVPRAAAGRRDGRAARLLRRRGGARDAARQHRPDPGPLPRQAADAAARRPLLGAVVTTPGGPVDDGTASTPPPARRRRRPGARPAGRAARPPRRAAPGLHRPHGLRGRRARPRGRAGPARGGDGGGRTRSGEEVARSLTFEASSVSILLRVADAGEDRVRLDGWLAPAVRAVVEVRPPDGDGDRVEPGDDGRFVVDGLRPASCRSSCGGRTATSRWSSPPRSSCDRADPAGARGVAPRGRGRGERPDAAARGAAPPAARPLPARRDDGPRGRAAAGTRARHGRARRVGAWRS